MQSIHFQNYSPQTCFQAILAGFGESCEFRSKTEQKCHIQANSEKGVKIRQHMEYANTSHEMHNMQHGEIHRNSAKYSALQPRVCRMRHKCLCRRGAWIQSVDYLVWIKSQPFDSKLLEGRVSRCGRPCLALEPKFNTPKIAFYAIWHP